MIKIHRNLGIEKNIVNSIKNSYKNSPDNLMPISERKTQRIPQDGEQSRDVHCQPYYLT